LLGHRQTSYGQQAGPGFGGSAGDASAGRFSFAQSPFGKRSPFRDDNVPRPVIVWHRQNGSSAVDCGTSCATWPPNLLDGKKLRCNPPLPVSQVIE
jgi:hypothetical protein